MRRFVRTALLLGFVALVQPADAAELRIALVIGNSAYAETPLANPANDARLMAETLRGLGFDVIERIDVDRKTIQLATFELQDRLIEAGKDAVGLFYYAGHGVQVGGQNYLIPLNSQIEKEREVAIEAVSAGFVLKQMEFAGNRMNFVILDACRNNPLTRGFRSAARGLARMDAPRGSLVAYSTGPGEVAADGTGANSPYTLALAQAMRTSGVAAEKMFKRVRDQVMDVTNGDQTPWEESSLTGADFYFSVAEAPAAASVTDTAAMTQQESLFWESIKDSRNAADFEAYLATFPDGVFATLASNRLDDIDAGIEAAQMAAEEATRQLAEDEATRLAAEAAARDAAEEEAARAAEEEARRRAAEEEAARIAAELAALKAAVEESNRLAAEKALRQAAEQEAARIAAEEATRQSTEEEVVVALAVQQADQDIDTPDWWTGEKIRAAFIDAGKKLTGTARRVWTESYRADGTILGRVAISHRELYSGNWSINGNVICFEYESSPAVREAQRRDWCGHLAIRGSRVLQWNEAGVEEEVEIFVVD